MIILDEMYYPPPTPGQPGLLAYWTSRGWFYVQQILPLVLPQSVAPLALVTPAAMMFEMEGSGI
jgi:hypothetical protein